ncbi:MAG: FTR1 family iron permease [Spirochaetaceae bacterium]|nr:FTR1 family iron permease [Spirochaetaceae bacterium]
MTRKSFVFLLLLVLVLAAGVFGEPWSSVEEEMRRALSEAWYSYVAGNIDDAAARVDAVFSGMYRETGFESNVRSRISGERADNIEAWFTYVKNSMTGGVSQREMRKNFSELNRVLRVTANSLDGKEEPVASERNWTGTAAEMSGILDEAYSLFRSGDAQGAKDKVDVAYYQYYEKLGFEKVVMTRISGERASRVEYQFSTAKKAITRGDDAETRESLGALAEYLKADAAQLDSKTENAWGVFLGSLLIILREGFEAIIIVGAIIAYLIKSGNNDKVKAVYLGSVIALGFSVVMAWVFNILTGNASGQNQELIEGFTMLLAVGVLFYVSNWMVSKAEAEAWSGYIENKVKSSLARGSVFSLSFAAFLAVFREGAETILFYQALLAGNKTYINMIWIGLGIGAVLLVIIYLAIRFLSVKIPLKPFFLGTSILLFIMSISFTGSGIKELQEGNLVSVTMLPFNFTVDILGIYPTLETLIPQIILLVITVITFVVQMRRNSRKTSTLKT